MTVLGRRWCLALQTSPSPEGPPEGRSPRGPCVYATVWLQVTPICNHCELLNRGGEDQGCSPWVPMPAECLMLSGWEILPYSLRASLLLSVNGVFTGLSWGCLSRALPGRDPGDDEGWWCSDRHCWKWRHKIPCVRLRLPWWLRW